MKPNFDSAGDVGKATKIIAQMFQHVLKTCRKMETRVTR
jgi:hypothetical protein